MEYMATVPDNAFNIAICDPEYGINADVKNSTNKKQSAKSAAHSNNYGEQRWDNSIPDENYFKEIFRISKNQIIWGVNYFPYKMLSGGRIYWDKCVTMPTYSDGELAYCSFINSIRSVKIAWHGMIQSDMKNKETRIHPTQKPVALYKWLLKNYAKEGDKIFDSHCGSGSIAIACHDYKFDLTACEIDEDYYKASKKRLEDHQKQLTMF